MQGAKSESFRFQRNTSRNSSGSSTRSEGQEHCRKRLKDKFDECEKENPNNYEDSKNTNDRTVLSVLNLNDTRRYIRNGAERISKTFNTVRVTFGTLSQRFKSATRRRQILQEGPMTPNGQTPYTKSRQMLGRTPTKMYSPFGIESPYCTTTIDRENTLLPSSLIRK
ncbi:unnamed protein product [Ceutorhynchus assimilis]|uniref:Uncharacterized protein n=1 Tax=Ceutorhynchus assimilis TaxID=467358 RepID=A0A9N9MY93_9CUCU|nr:unnamed protein product [Ceutorhynchus assimilis]